MEARKIIAPLSALALIGGLGGIIAYGTHPLGTKAVAHSYVTPQRGPTFTACAPTGGKGKAVIAGITQQGTPARVLVNGKEVEAEAPAGAILQAPPSNGKAAVAVGLQSNTPKAFSTCESPRTSMWLLGGATTTGTDSTLLLANPSEEDSTVTIEAFSKTGPVDLVSSRVSLPAGQTVTVPLAGLAPEEERVSLHLTATGAGVSAWLQQSMTKGLNDLGAEVTEAAEGPDMTNLIPGVGFADAQLQITNPANKAIHAQVYKAEGDERIPVPGGKVTVEPGAVAEISLAGLGQGRGTVQVLSDKPVLAAVRERQDKDFTWTTARAAAKDGILIVPKGGQIYASANADGVVEFRGAGQTPKKLKVPALKSASVALPEGTWQWKSDGPVAITAVVSKSAISTFTSSRSARELTAIGVKIR